MAALSEDGRLFLWGRNNYGQPGDGSREDNWTPKLVKGKLTNLKAAQVALGENYTMALTKDKSFAVATRAITISSGILIDHALREWSWALTTIRQSLKGRHMCFLKTANFTLGVIICSPNCSIGVMIGPAKWKMMKKTLDKDFCGNRYKNLANLESL